MRISSEHFDLPQWRGPDRLKQLAEGLRERIGSYAYPLRFSIVESSPERLRVEASVVHFDQGGAYARELSDLEIDAPRRKTHQSETFCVVQVVPTGIRCEFGGYAGDATPVTNLLAASADFVVTHPNVVNASDINEFAPNVLYVEGKSLDDFLVGQLGLRRTRGNRVGTFVDPSGLERLDDVLHTLNAAKAVAGIACDSYLLLDSPVGARVEWLRSGSAGGSIDDPEAILEGVAQLIADGAQAVGGVSVIHGVTQEMCRQHRRGELPNPSGTVEAIITHLVSRIFRVPCAHAPLPYYEDVKDRSTENPRSSAEFISTPHYFSVLKGLSRAPRLVAIDDLDRPPMEVITINDVGAIIVPASALGGIPALAADHHGIPLIAVRENRTILDVTAERLALPGVIEVASYLEAAGVVTALRNGIAIDSLRRPILRAQALNDLAEAPIRKRE